MTTLESKRKTDDLFGVASISEARNKTCNLGSTSNHKPKSICQNLHDIGLPGLDSVCDRKISSSKRLFWFIVCCLIWGCCAYQCADRFDFYFNGPPAVSMEYVRNRSITFPSVTICPGNINGVNPSVWPTLLKDTLKTNQTYKTSFDLVKQTGMNVMTLWEISRIQFRNLTFTMSKGIDLNEGRLHGSDDLELSPLLTTSGTCFTITPKKEVPHNGMFTYMKIIGEISPLPEGHNMMYRYLVHLKEDTQLIRYAYAFDGIHSRFGKGAYSTHRIEETIWLNRWQLPCVDLKTYTECTTKCLQKIILDSVSKPCRLPYMVEDFDRIPECVTSEEFMEVFLATSKVLRSFDSTECKCYRQCRDISYPWEMFNERARSNPDLLELIIYIPENRVQVIKEQMIYNLSALFSDIGGGIGLYLGLSLLHVFQIVDILFAGLCALCTTAERKHF